MQPDKSQTSFIKVLPETMFTIRYGMPRSLLNSSALLIISSNISHDLFSKGEVRTNCSIWETQFTTEVKSGFFKLVQKLWPFSGYCIPKFSIFNSLVTIQYISIYTCIILSCSTKLQQYMAIFFYLEFTSIITSSDQNLVTSIIDLPIFYLFLYSVKASLQAYLSKPSYSYPIFTNLVNEQFFLTE